MDADLSAPDAMPSPDGGTGPDGGVTFGCNPTGSYVEANDSGNDLFGSGAAAESTGQTITGGGSAFTIGGCIDPAYATGSVADADFYDFTVTGTGTQAMRVALSADLGVEATNLTVAIYDTTGNFLTGVLWNEAVGGGLMAGIGLDPGSYWLVVWADLPVPAGSITYSVAVSPFTTWCTDGDDVSYTEADESGVGHRANDMVTISYSPFAATATVVADSPESTGFTLVSGQKYGLSGTSGDAGAAGNYLDADTYLIRTGADATELWVDIRWGVLAGVDMDFYVFPAGDPSTVVWSSTATSEELELTVFPLEPNTDYWFWVASYDNNDPFFNTLDYSIHICARTAFP